MYVMRIKNWQMNLSIRSPKSNLNFKTVLMLIQYLKIIAARISQDPSKANVCDHNPFGFLSSLSFVLVAIRGSYCVSWL